MAELYPYLGGQEMWYQAYLDTATGRMLTARPGGSYTMTAVDPGMPVPPSDGRWGTPAPAVPEPASDPEPLPEPAGPATEPEPAPEGGEE